MHSGKDKGISDLVKLISWIDWCKETINSHTIIT